jgi:ribosomal protein L16/L10AE
MYYVLGRHKVDDVAAWKKAMEADRRAQLAMGLHFEEVWANVENPKEIFFTFEVDDLERARAALRKAGALDEEKRKRGEIPELFFLETK